MNRFKLIQQLDSATANDDKKRILKKLCNDCTGLELDLEKYATSFGKAKFQEKKKEEEDVDFDLTLVRLKAVDILNIKVLWLAVARKTTTAEALKRMCYESFGFPMSCQTLFRGDNEGPINDKELLDYGGAFADEPYLSFDLYLSKNSLGKSGGDVIEEHPTLSDMGSLVSEISLPVSVVAKQDAMDWACPACTFINLSWRPGCEMCNTTRPPS